MLLQCLPIISPWRFRKRLLITVIDYCQCRLPLLAFSHRNLAFAFNMIFAPAHLRGVFRFLLSQKTYSAWQRHVILNSDNFIIWKLDRAWQCNGLLTRLSTPNFMDLLAWCVAQRWRVEPRRFLPPQSPQCQWKENFHVSKWSWSIMFRKLLCKISNVKVSI